MEGRQVAAENMWGNQGEWSGIRGYKAQVKTPYCHCTICFTQEEEAMKVEQGATITCLCKLQAGNQISKQTVI